MKTIGIDLGTTNSVGAIDGNVLQHATSGDTSPIVPSVVAYPPSGATLVGATAKRRRAIDPKSTIFSAKRLMGQGWHSYAATNFKEQYPFDLVEVGDDCGFKTRAGTFTPQDIGGRIIDKVLLARPASDADCQVVISVPAAFQQAARDATIDAAGRAGLTDVSIVEEPIATAIAYSTIRSDRPRHAVVYDLGGGTFDLAILDCRGESAAVVGYGGDAYLGGDDIDRRIADWAADQVIERFGWDLRSSAEVFDRLMLQSERAKIRLAFAAETAIELSQVDPAAPMAGESVTLDRQRVQELAGELVARTFAICDEVVRDAKLHTSDIDAVYLAGGATLLPMVRDGVARYFSVLPRCDFDPMEVVAIGASLSRS